MSPLSRWFARPRTILAILLAIAVFVAAELPSVRVGAGRSGPPVYSVAIRHFGVDAPEIESSITIPLEEALSALTGIDRLRCFSEYGKSTAEISLSPGVDPDKLYLPLRDAVNSLSAALPRSAQRPEILDSGGGQRPFLIAAATVDGLTIDQTHDWADRVVRPALERIDGVGAVEIAGGARREVRVEVDQRRAAAVGITLPALARQIGGSSLLRPVGRLPAGALELPIVVCGRLGSIGELAALPVELGRSKVIELGDIASVGYRPSEPESISRIDGERRVTLSVTANGDAKILAASRAVRARLSSLAHPGVAFTVVYDLGDQLASSLIELIRSIVVATGAVSLFIALALRPLRNALLLALLIPAVTLLSLSLLAASGIVVDQYVLAGFAAGIGLIVDPGVIVLSALQSEPAEAGASGRAKAVNALVSPLGASAATTLVGVLPLFALRRSVPGLAAIASALLVIVPSSLLLTLLFLPAFAARGARTGRRWRADHQASRRARRLLLGAVLWSSSRPWPVLASAGGMCVTGILAALHLDLALGPPVDSRSIYARLELDGGTELTAADRKVASLARRVLASPGVEHVESVARRENAAVMVVLEEREGAAERARRVLLEPSNRPQGVFVYLPASERAGGQSIEVSVTGPEERVLQRLATRVAAELQAADWVQEVVLNFKPGPPVLDFTPDQPALLGRGLSAARVAEGLRWGIYGPVALKWFDPVVGEMDLRVSGLPTERTSRSAVAAAIALSPTGRVIELSQLGRFEVACPPGRLSRVDRQRSLSFTIHSDLRSTRSLLGRLEADLRARPLPIGYAFRIDPAVYRLLEETRSAALLIAACAALVFVVIAAQTESLTAPLLVMSVLPLSLSAPLIALWLGGSVLDLSVLVSLVMLEGVVVNNAILVLDRTLARGERLDRLSRGDVRLSLLLSIRRRLRALFVTSAAAVVGVIPLLVGQPGGFTLLRSLALVMLCGTIASLLATVLVLPALASLLPALADRQPRLSR